MPLKKVGEIRRGQLITTFGIGAIIDLRDYSVMVSGQQDWDEKRLVPIREERLEKKLKVRTLYQPAAVKESKDISVPCIRFPKWVFCRVCKRLAHIDGFGGTEAVKCSRCSRRNNPQHLVPTRFIIACEQGHIDDFPWTWWVHKGSDCENPELVLNSTGRTTSLAGITVSCRTCGSYRSLFGIFSSGALRDLNCPGKRPWLRDRVVCDAKPLVLQRSSASVYFPIIESAISIPPFSGPIFRLFHSPDVEPILDQFKNDPEILKSILKGLIERKGLPYDVELVMGLYLAREQFMKSDDSPDIRFEEYLALRDPGQMDPQSDFYAVKGEIPASFKSLISRVVLVHRLREVRALKTFKRIRSESQYLSKLSSDQENWLPAGEVNGEGIFIELNRDAIRDWKERGDIGLRDRAHRIEKIRKKLKILGKWTVIEDEITPEYLLIHTLSHMMMRQLTIECGYSSASLRERLYVCAKSDQGELMHGFLIYTAADDSEGSLGGLVRQAWPDRLNEVLSRMVEDSIWCSNDPLCMESLGQGMHSLNLAACHDCALVPETSCEIMNKNCYLDRGVVIGVADKRTIGYFQ